MDFDIILKHLRITKNELTELKILNLSLSNTQQITDISALSGLINLETLYLNNTQITDVSALYGLTKLKNLSLYDYTNNISVLSGLTKLSISGLIDIQHLKIYNKYLDRNSLVILNNMETLIFDTMRLKINN